MGLVYLQTKRAAHGIAELERSLALNPNLAEAHGFIGLAKVFDGRAEEAEQHEKEALRLSPRDHSAWLWTHFIGGAKMQLGSDDEAAIWFRRAIELNPNLPLTHFFLAATLAHLGKLEEARAETQVGLALDPTFTLRRHVLGRESDNPVFVRQTERVTVGLRKAGVPEG
jgi:tetratricopeptide (TPR) repeat protein